MKMRYKYAMGKLLPKPKRIFTVYIAGLVLLITTMCLYAHAQDPEPSGPVPLGEDQFELPTVDAEPVTDTMQLGRILRFVPDADLERFPVKKYRVKTDPDFRGLRIGDTIPEALWDLPLWVVNHPEGQDTITLSEYRESKLLVLDFWAKFCKPCIESMDKWKTYAAELNGSVSLIGVHIDFDYKALPFSRQRGWEAPSVIGENARILNRCFFYQVVLGQTVWIRDGKLAAITGGKGYDLGTVRRFANNQPVIIPIDTSWTYSSEIHSIIR